MSDRSHFARAALTPPSRPVSSHPPLTGRWPLLGPARLRAAFRWRLPSSPKTGSSVQAPPRPFGSLGLASRCPARGARPACQPADRARARAGQGRPGQARAGQGRPGQGRPGQARAGAEEAVVSGVACVTEVPFRRTARPRLMRSISALRRLGRRIRMVTLRKAENLRIVRAQAPFGCGAGLGRAGRRAGWPSRGLGGGPGRAGRRTAPGGRRVGGRRAGPGWRRAGGCRRGGVAPGAPHRAGRATRRAADAAGTALVSRAGRLRGVLRGRTGT